MKGLVFLVCGLMLFFNTALAQYKISGNVTDEDSIALEFVAVSLLLNDSIVSQIVSDSVGFFEVKNVSNGNYNIEFEYLDRIKRQHIEIESKDITLSIIIDSVSQNLGSVIIEGRKPIIEKKIDRLIFNVENNITAIGGNALEALSKTPYVQVKNEYIGLIGKSSVAVMVNDKLIQLSGPDLLNYLQSIRSDDISRIEVITNPSAKYDAEGNSGLINIVMKQNKKNDFISGNILASHEQRTYISNSGGIGLNYRKDNFYISTGVNANYGRTAPVEELTAKYPDRKLEQISNRIDYRKNISGRLLAEYEISAKSKIGVQYMGGYSLPDIKEDIKSSYSIGIDLDSTINTKAYKNTQSIFNSCNIYYHTLLDSAGKKMFFDISYFNTKTENERPFNSNTYNNLGELINGSFIGNRNNGLQNISIITSKLDFEIPNKIANLTFGAKASFMKNKSNNAMFNLIGNEYFIDPSQSDTFQYSENIQAVYFTLSKAVNKWEFQFGLRGENTQTKGVSIINNTSTENNYFKLFPTAYISYNPNENNVFSLKYGRRIGRPNYGLLNPFRWYLNTHNYSEGNPYLQPTFLHYVELGHLYKNRLNTTAYFSYQANGYNQLAFVEENSETLYFKPINFFTQISIGINVYYQFEIAKRITTKFIADMYYTISRSKINITENQKSMLSANFQIQNSVVFNEKKTLFADFNIWYQLPQVSGILNERSSASIDLGLKYLMLDKRLSLVLNASDIFRTNYNRYYNTINGIDQTFNNYYDNRLIRFSINYQFGNKSIRNKQQSQSNDEERKRT